MNEYGILLVAKQTKYLFLQIILKKNVDKSTFFFVSNRFSELYRVGIIIQSLVNLIINLMLAIFVCFC